MNIQFATQFLREELDEFDSLRSALSELGASKDTIDLLVNAVAKGRIEPSKAIEIVKSTVVREDGAAGSMTGGGTTGGASFTPGTGEQYASTQAFKRVKEDAPILAGGKADISTYTQDGFTGAPSIPNRKSKAIDYKKLFEDDLVSENYSRFKTETKVRPKAEQYHQAIKVANRKLDEVNKILEFTSRMKNELSEGEQTLEVKGHTVKAAEKLKAKIAEAYKKIKTLS